MAKTHNKKRNIAIIFEQLLNKAAMATVDKNDVTANAAIGIIDKHFVPGTELYKEFRLFNALIKTTVPSEAIAVRILEESKKAAKTHDASALRKQKSALIKEINYTFKDPKFYNQNIKNYRDYATIQTLLNDWRSSSPDIMRIANYETQTVKMLLSEKNETSLESEKSSDINQLTVNIMTEKFNQKYGMILNDEQVSIIQDYVFTSMGEDRGLLERLNKMKSEVVRELRKYKTSCSNDILLEKFEKVQDNISEVKADKIDDETISRFLLLSKLKQEISEKQNG